MTRQQHQSISSLKANSPPAQVVQEGTTMKQGPSEHLGAYSTSSEWSLELSLCLSFYGLESQVQTPNVMVP